MSRHKTDPIIKTGGMVGMTGEETERIKGMVIAMAQIEVNKTLATGGALISITPSTFGAATVGIRKDSAGAIT